METAIVAESERADISHNVGDDGRNSCGINGTNVEPQSSSSLYPRTQGPMDPQTALVLQTDSVTNAVDSLMSGYDRLNENLPGIAAKVATMQSETEQMATKLEEKMRFLVDGFEHLDSVSSQIPESIRALADANKTNILESTNMVAESQLNGGRRAMDDLERLKNELSSITLERTTKEIQAKYLLKDSGFWNKDPRILTGSVRNQNGRNGSSKDKKSALYDFIDVPSYTKRDDNEPQRVTKSKKESIARSGTKWEPEWKSIPEKLVRALHPPAVEKNKTTKKAHTRTTATVKELKNKFGKTDQEILQLKEKLQRDQEIHAKQLEHSKKQLNALKHKIVESDQSAKEGLEKIIANAMFHIEKVVGEQAKLARLGNQPTVIVHDPIPSSSSSSSTRHGEYKVLTVGGKGQSVSVTPHITPIREPLQMKTHLPTNIRSNDEEVKRNATAPSHPIESEDKKSATTSPQAIDKTKKSDEKKIGIDDDPYRQQETPQEFVLAVDGDTSRIKWLSAGYVGGGNNLTDPVLDKSTLGEEGFLEYEFEKKRVPEGLFDLDVVGRSFDNEPITPEVELFSVEAANTARVNERDIRYVDKEADDIGHEAPRPSTIKLFPARELLMSKVTAGKSVNNDDSKNDEGEVAKEPSLTVAPSTAPSNGLETELVSLLETVIQSQQVAMQGQQALMLEALRNQATLEKSQEATVEAALRNDRDAADAIAKAAAAAASEPSSNNSTPMVINVQTPAPQPIPPSPQEEANKAEVLAERLKAETAMSEAKATEARAREQAAELKAEAKERLDILQREAEKDHQREEQRIHELEEQLEKMKQLEIERTEAIHAAQLKRLEDENERLRKLEIEKEDRRKAELQEMKAIDHAIELERNRGYELRAAAHLTSDIQEAVSMGIHEGVQRVLRKNKFKMSEPPKKNFMAHAEAALRDAPKHIERDMKDSKDFIVAMQDMDISDSSLEDTSSDMVEPKTEKDTTKAANSDDDSFETYVSEPGFPKPLLSSILAPPKRSRRNVGDGHYLVEEVPGSVNVNDRFSTALPIHGAGLRTRKIMDSLIDNEELERRKEYTEKLLENQSDSSFMSTPEISEHENVLQESSDDSDFYTVLSSRDSLNSAENDLDDLDKSVNASKGQKLRLLSLSKK